jgi:hypothetical protein
MAAPCFSGAGQMANQIALSDYCLQFLNFVVLFEELDYGIIVSS